MKQWAVGAWYAAMASCGVGAGGENMTVARLRARRRHERRGMIADAIRFWAKHIDQPD